MAALQSYFSDLGWTFESVEKDYGLDAKVEAFKDNQVRAFIFFVQSKGTEVDLRNTQSVSQYFDEEEVNYFTDVNVPVLVTRYSTANNIIFAKWAYSTLSFSKTRSRYKLSFSTKDILSLENVESFITSIDYIEEISRFYRGGPLTIKLSGDVADTLTLSKFCRAWFGIFGIPLQINEDSSLSMEVTKDALSLYVFGIINESKENSILGLLEILEIVSSGISEKLNYQIRLLKMINQPNHNNSSIIELANNFRKDVDYFSSLGVKSQAEVREVGSCTVFSAMKDTRSRPAQSSLTTLLAEHFPLDPRRLTVLSALILAVIQARSVVLYQLVQLIDLPGSDDTVYQRLKRFVQFSLPDLLVARFVLAHLPDEHLLFVFDRTNWKVGQQDINILLLSVRWQTFSFPLLWTLLPHGGNSNMATRIALVERLLPLLQGRRLFLTADREFVGGEWFVALRRMHISPVVRLRADSVVEGSPVWVRFKKLRPGELRVWYKPVQVYGVPLRVLACQNASHETLFLAYQGHAGPALKRYALRWTAENMHQALKSRGFFLESTHLTDPTRVSTLLAVVALAFVWCCLVGEFEQQRDPSRCLRHGYPPKSLFRRGLDALRAVLNKPKRSTERDFSLFLATFDP